MLESFSGQNPSPEDLHVAQEQQDSIKPLEEKIEVSSLKNKNVLKQLGTVASVSSLIFALSTEKAEAKEKENREAHKKEKIALIRKQLVEKSKEDPFVVRAGRTIGHVSESLVENTGESIVEEVKEVVNTPKNIGEAVMGRDFDKHIPIGPTERFKKAANSVIKIGGIAAAASTSGASLAIGTGVGMITEGAGKTVLEHNPKLKKLLNKDEIEIKMPEIKKKKPFFQRLFSR